MPQAPVGVDPTCLVDTTPQPVGGSAAARSTSGAGNPQHTYTRLYTERSPQLGSWAGQDARSGGLVTASTPAVTSSPPRRRPGRRTVRRRAATGRRPDRLGRLGYPDRRTRGERKGRRELSGRPAVPYRGGADATGAGLNSKGPATGSRNRRWRKLRDVRPINEIQDNLKIRQQQQNYFSTLICATRLQPVC